jgi:hypothetical protein
MALSCRFWTMLRFYFEEKNKKTIAFAHVLSLPDIFSFSRQGAQAVAF